MAVISTLVASLPSLSNLVIYTFLAFGVYVILNILNQLVKQKKIFMLQRQKKINYYIYFSLDLRTQKHLLLYSLGSLLWVTLSNLECKEPLQTERGIYYVLTNFFFRL